MIVLKQSVRSESRWLFDLLHEFHHAGDDVDGDSFEPVATNGTDPERRGVGPGESGERFRWECAFGRQCRENLYGQVLERARRRVPQIKRAVESLAEENHFDVGALANYVAYRLSAKSDADWWGAAINLQPDTEDAYSTTAAVFKERFPFDNLPEDERMLVELAVSEPAL